MTTATNWLLNWAIAYSTPYLVSSGPGNANLQVKVFFIWGSCCFVCIAFVYFFIYETKGLTLEQVDEMYEKINKAYKSKHFVPSTNFREIEEALAENRKASLAEIEQVVLRKKSVAAGTDGVAEHRDGISDQGDERADEKV
jgi:MFS transporter, SP family, sugar:H+ symporter